MAKIEVGKGFKIQFHVPSKLKSLHDEVSQIARDLDARIDFRDSFNKWYEGELQSIRKELFKLKES